MTNNNLWCYQLRKKIVKKRQEAVRVRTDFYNLTVAMKNSR